MNLKRQKEEQEALALQENKLDLYFINLDILTFRFTREAQDKINAMIGLMLNSKDKENKRLGIALFCQTFKGFPEAFFTGIHPNYRNSNPFRHSSVGKDYLVTRRIYDILNTNLINTGSFLNMRKQLAKKEAIKQKLIKINKFLSN